MAKSGKNSVSEFKSRRPDRVSGCNSAAYFFDSQKVPKKVPTSGFSKPSNFIRASLCDHGGDLSKKWYIDVFITDAATGLPVRKRISKKINSFKTASERHSYASSFIQLLSQMMAEGYYFSRKTKFEMLEINGQAQPKPEALTLQLAFRKVIDHKAGNSKAELNRYKFLLRELEKFEARHRPVLLEKCTTQQVELFLSHLETERSISAKTFNHYRNTLSTVFNYFRKRGEIPRNPVEPITTKRVIKGTFHKPLTMAEVGLIRQYAESVGDHQYVLFMAIAVYTLARPGKEIRFLRIGDISERWIWISPENSKPGEGRRVEVLPNLQRILARYDFSGYAKTDYLFTAEGRPGPVPPGEKYFFKRQAKYLKAVGLDCRGHDVYCFKHSGACMLMESGFSIYQIQHMAGHKDYKQTEQYLYNIGAVSKFGPEVNNVPDF